MHVGIDLCSTCVVDTTVVLPCWVARSSLMYSVNSVQRIVSAADACNPAHPNPFHVRLQIESIHPMQLILQCFSAGLPIPRTIPYTERISLHPIINYQLFVSAPASSRCVGSSCPPNVQSQGIMHDFKCPTNSTWSYIQQPSERNLASHSMVCGVVFENGFMWQIRRVQYEGHQ